MPNSDVTVREYRAEDEQQWLRCRVLSFLNTAHFDHVLREKERDDNPAIELVAEVGGSVIGLMDLECEITPGTVCSAHPGLGAMIWHVAVHPDYQRRGIAGALLAEAIAGARRRGIVGLEAWTRDDAWVQNWYERQGFERLDSYLHVLMDGGKELRGVLRSEMQGLMPVVAFGHYVGDDWGGVRAKFKRVHECVRIVPFRRVPSVRIWTHQRCDCVQIWTKGGLFGRFRPKNRARSTSPSKSGPSPGPTSPETDGVRRGLPSSGGITLVPKQRLKLHDRPTIRTKKQRRLYTPYLELQSPLFLGSINQESEFSCQLCRGW